MKTIPCVVLALGALAGTASGQTPAPGPSPDPPGMERRYPPPRVPDTTPHRVTVPGAPNRLRGSAGGESLRGWRAVSLGEGKGRVAVGGVSREIVPGQVVEGYTVRSVAPDRVVLARATPPGPGQPAGGTELAVVLFGQAGGTRVLRIFDQDPTPQGTRLR